MHHALRRHARTLAVTLALAAALALAAGADGAPAATQEAPTLSASSATADVGASATITVTLGGLSSPGLSGYAFDLAYDDTALSLDPASTSACLGGEGTLVAPALAGPSPYSIGCAKLSPAEGLYSECDAGSCVLAAVVFVCHAGGVFGVSLDPGSATFIDASGSTGAAAVIDGAVTCAGEGARIASPRRPTPPPTAFASGDAEAAAYAGVATMRVGSANAAAGATASVEITLEGVPAPGQVGYAFDIYYDDAALTRVRPTSGSCNFGEGGVPPRPQGPSPFFAGCVNLPAPGLVHADCTPGPCTLATAIFVCSQPGTFELRLDPQTSYWASVNVVPILATAVSGTITCAAPEAAPTLPDASPTAPDATQTPADADQTASPTPTAQTEGGAG